MTKIKPLGEYVRINPVHSDRVGGIMVLSNASEGERGVPYTGYVMAIGDDVKYVKENDLVILDQYAMETIQVEGKEVYLIKESRLKGVIEDV